MHPLVEWMTNLPDEVRSRVPIFGLAIPGSHNSFTSSLDTTLPVGPHSVKLVTWLGNHFGCIVKPIIHRWSVCQVVGAEEQLLNGVRYFDIRMGKLNWKTGPEFRVIHTLFGEMINLPLVEIRNFLDLHPSEVVLLDFQHQIAFDSEKDYKTTGDIIKGIFGPKLRPCAAQDLQRLTLNEMRSGGHQVIAIYPRMAACDNAFWPRDFFPNPWADTTSKSELIEFLDDGLEGKSPNQFFVSQGIFTPSGFFVALHLTSTLEKSLGYKCNKVLGNWIKSARLPTAANVIMADFVEDRNNLTIWIVEMNKRKKR